MKLTLIKDQFLEFVNTELVIHLPILSGRNKITPKTVRTRQSIDQFELFRAVRPLHHKMDCGYWNR